MSRSPSPASQRGSPEPLTPRSKLRALLATVDSSDDDGTTTLPSLNASTELPQAARARLGPRLNPPMAMLNNSDEDSDEDIRPRGKLASRMQGAAVSATATTKPIVVQESPNEQHRTKIPASNTEDGNTADTESDNDTLPVAPRRLKRKLVAVQPDAASEPAARSPSPGLFVSSPAGPSPAKSIAINKDAEPELPAMKTDRFKALVERKKQERLAREAAEEARKAERRAQQEKIFSELDTNDSNVSDITDDEGGRRLTQDARPTRKASKKAIEEMTRETQRMARSMQLAHEAKTKKKISKNSLFERFNFKPVRGPEPKTTSSSRPSTPHSDVDMKDAETPPSSPPAADKLEKAEAAVTESAIQDNQVQHSDAPLDKGKGKAIAVPNHSGKPEVATKRHVRVILPDSAAFPITIDSDDELQITTTAKDRINAVFDRVPAKRSEGLSSLKALRVLAQVRSPGKQSRRKDDQSGMSISALQASLQQKARQQAKFERERRLNMLKAQGIVIQTAEEREREMEEVEDLVARAREEAQHIMAQEREDAKKNKGDNENDPLAWDDSEDDDYDERGEDADAEVSDVELSGSEEEADAEEEEEADGNPLFDASASEGESEAAEEAVSTMDKVEESDDEMGEIEELPTRRRPRRQAAIVSDDDEAAVEATPRSETLIQATPNPKSKAHATPKAPSTISPAPGSVLRSARKTFIPGLPVAGPAGLGLTQIFAGTMDDSQMSTGQAPTQSMMPDFDNFPDSNFSATMDEIPGSIGPDSLQDETQNATQGVRLNLSQSQMRGLESLQYGANTQLSDILELEPSQDGGLQEYTPLKERFVEPPHSTVDTVIVGHEDVPQDSPLVRRGRLRRKVDTAASEAEVAIPSTNPEPTVFNVMKEGAKKEQKKQLIDEFNRKKSKAKEMIEEQAEESEDEYQGLGGYDGEDSDDDSTTSVKDMIDDDATASTMDEAKLAAFYADRERANDEKQVEQLFKDITTGMLRRKRGADYDLSDSDDGGEARRRMKRRQFAKMQKALFSDERVKKMAENPGNQAFLRTMEDRGSDDEMDFLDVVEEPSQQSSESQEEQSTALQQQQQQQQSVVPDSQPRTALANASENRAPAAQRRTKGGRKPANLGEVRETLSDLLEDGREGSIIPATEAGSDSEDEEDEGGNDPSSSARSDKENHAPNPRRRPAVVDRISLKRNASSNSAGAGSRLAFTASVGSSTFKVPALLRRATTNSLKSTGSSSGASSTGVTTPTFGVRTTGSAGFGDDAKIKKAAGKRSGVNAFARENERRAKINEGERRRELKKVKGAERRVGVVGGLLGKGSFE